MQGFLAIVSNRAAGSSIVPAVRSAIAGRPELTIVVDDAGLLVATSGGLASCRLPRGNGWILGSIFRAGSSAPADFSAGGVAWDCEGGTPPMFTRAYWGHYVGFLHVASGGIDVVRAPFGQLPCLYAHHAGTLLLASDIELLELAGWTPAGLDWDAIVHRLLYQNVPSAATCLAGVSELRGGSGLGFRDGMIDVGQVWTPWDHAGRRHWFAGRGEAAHALGQAVMTAVHATVGDAGCTLLMLSGGLDSSVLAAALSTRGGSFRCFNLSSRGGGGDERRYARAVARHLATPIIEAEWDVGLVDITRSHAAGLPNPVARGFMQATNALAGNAMAQSGASLLLDGGAGDNVFCALQSVAPVTDAFVRGRSLHEGWEAAVSIASIAQVGVPTVLARAARRAFRGSSGYRWQGETSYLASALFNGPAITAGHPWLRAPRGSETGTAAHIALIVAAQAWGEACDLQSSARHGSPLASQPVVEACLRVPSWWWFGDGRNRVIARAAFADRLPAEIVERRSKGSPDSFIAELYAANRATIRSILLDGRLRAAGMLDVAALERTWAEGGLLRGTDYHRIMRLVDVETWIAGRT